jgi:CheY-like chemotaxis protein
MLVITDMLIEAGFSVIPAFDGEEGLTLALEELPDVITLDVMLPGLDGWEVLRRLKADPLVCEIPVIVATAIDETGFGLNLGAADYVVKPIRKHTLLGVMQRLSNGQTHQCLDIAIVDDDPNVRDIISEVLTEAEFKASCYESGDAFLQALPNHRPDAIVLDLMMPGTDGFGVVETLKQDPEYANIPIVVMTAQALSSKDLTNLNRHVRSVIEKNGLSRKRSLRDLLQQLKTLQLETVEG